MEKIALFVTCLVDLLRPEIGFAAVKLLRQSGADIVLPEQQTCCGQPAYNSGDAKTAKDLAKQHIRLLEGYDRIIVPSASCAGMMKWHYPALLESEPAWGDRARQYATKVMELTQYLHGKVMLKKNGKGRVCLHDSCSALREMRVTEEPRDLLAQKNAVPLKESRDPHACCGFGGAFSVKFPDISHKMAEEKLRAFKDSGADTISSCDLGCLLHLEGSAERMGLHLRFRHIAEILADD